MTALDRNEKLLSVKNLTISVGEKILLKDVSLSLYAGEVLAILGANGAGKSTLLNHIIEKVPHSQSGGDVNFCQQSLTELAPQKRAQQMALLTQASRLSFPFTVEEVIRLGRTPHSTGKQFDDDLLARILARLDIAHLRGQLYPSLSGGEQQRVNLARVFAQLSCFSGHDSYNITPRLLLLDEPCAALDIQHQQQLLMLIQELQCDNIAVILVAHDLNWASQCADQFLALKQGEVIAQGDAQAVMTTECLRKVYGVEASIIEHPNSGRPMVIM